MIRDATATQPVFANAPMVIQESLLFPYVNGMDFVRRYESRHPGSMPFDSLPQSTEQVLHDAAFFGKTPDRPIQVALPKIPGAFYQNDLGEFGTRLVLFNFLKNTNVSASAAAGWGGDRYAVVHTPKGDGIVWVSAWDTARDAAEFVSSLTAAIATRFGGELHTLPNASVDAGGGKRYDFANQTIVVATREIDGRTVVAYTQVPRGTSTALLDFAKVTLH